jgi:AcrR family transcriptional regulator
VSWAAPAHHFPDKAALLTAFAVEAFERLATHISEWRDSAGTDPKRRLAATGLGYVDFALAHPAHYRVMFSGDLLRTDDAALDAAHERIRTCIAEALAACSSPSNDTEAETAAVLTWSALHGFASLFVHGVLCDGGLAPRDGRALANGLVERLLPAVLGPSRRRTTRRQRARP